MIELSKVTQLVFSGGAMKGYCFIGVLKFLEEHDCIKNINHLIGTSVGSCISLLINIGFTSDELTQLMSQIDIFKYYNLKSDTILNIFDTYGINCGNDLIHSLKIIIKKKLGKDNITFKELYDKTNIKLTMIGCHLNTMNTILYNHETSPDMNVIDALRISISVPIIFDPVKINGDYYVDGGLTNNYAIDIFDKDIDNTLGILLDDTTKIIINSFDSYMMSIILSSFNSQNIIKKKQYKNNTICIQVAINSMDFSMSIDTKKELIQYGYTIIKDYYTDVSITA